MNNFKKIATVAVTVVMAGSMAASFSACGKKHGSNVAANTDFNNVATTATVDGLTINLSEDGRLAYDAGTTLNLNVGDTNVERRITYDETQISGEVKLPDGEIYQAGDLKPAWAAASTFLGIEFNNAFQAKSSDEQITTPISEGKLANYDVITGSGSKIVEEGAKAENTWLDLSKFLDYMPNYKAFLENNPLVRLSLTSDTTTGTMYYAPYFDGNDDIEKYVLTKREWTRAILDAEDVSKATTTFAAQADAKKTNATTNSIDGTKASASAFMGTTGSWSVETTDPSDSTASKTVDLVVNYDSALTAAKNESTELGKAIKDAAGSVYTGTSGNIIDLQNYAINETSGNVTGAKLIKILQAYIDVAYQTKSGAKFYSTRSDVFNSVSAGWDADLMTALYRCVVTGVNLFDDSTIAGGIGNVYALAARQGTTQRGLDLVSYAGELYGVRGLESRLELYTYIGADGTLKDSRLNESTYTALENMSKLANEGLLYTGTTAAVSYYDSSSIQTFSEHDYCQTQTKYGFYSGEVEGVSLSGVISSGSLKYDFAPILTSVSNWDTDDNGTKDTIMRFTESWRSVKNTGFCVPYAAVSGDANKLSAVLNLIDYMFSNDGQIIFTYGSQSTNGNTNPNGWWYGTNVTASDDNPNGVYLTDVAEPAVSGSNQSQYVVKSQYAGQYFIFQNQVYTGTYYKGTQIPTLTDANLDFYHGLSVNGETMGGTHYKKNYQFNYTDYARGVIGSALPIGNKNQGFEYQGTSSCGIDGSDIVAAALTNGTIKHVTLQVDSSNLWYTAVPTTLPLTTAQSTTVSGQTVISNQLFYNNSKVTYSTTNFMMDIAFYGYDTTRNIANHEDLGTIPANAAACVTYLKGKGLETRVSIYQDGWNKIYTWYTSQSK
jgi:putative aldouronate transport system substrate-binding protein